VIRVALRGLAGRKLRAALTSIAIVLGVAMVSGAFILTDTLKTAADNLSADSYAGIDAVVSGREAEFQPDTEWNKTPPIPDEILASVRRVPEVGAAIGGILDQGKLVDAKGNVIGQPPNFAVGIDSRQGGIERLSPVKIGSGRWPRGPDEVAVDVGTAKREGFEIGDRVGVVPRGRVRSFQIVGLVRWAEVESIGNATMAAFDLKTAQQLFGKEGELDSVSVAAKAGVGAAKLRRELLGALPATVDVRSAEAADPFDFEGLQEFISIIKIFLLAFGGISLFVGAFIIFNTFSITVAQRAREFALLRTIGASRRQLLGSVLVEAFVTGLVATVVGVALGLGIAKGLLALMSALNLDLPRAGMIFAFRTVLVSLAVGVIVTILAGMVPAIRATRVAPVEVLREGATLPRSRLSPATPYLAVAGIVIGIASLVYGMFADGISAFPRVLVVVVGTLVLFLGVALLAPRLVRPLAWLLGWPAERIGGVAGRLARENATRNPGRTAVTASALMIGLALVTFVTVLGRGMRDTWGSTLDKQLSAEYVLTTDQGWDSFSPASAEALARNDDVESVSAVRTGQARADALDTNPVVSGVETSTITRFYRFGWEKGSDAVVRKLGRTGAIVLDDWAKDHDVAVGDRFRLRTREGTTLDLVARGIYRPRGVGSLLGDVVVSTAAFDAAFPRPRNFVAFVDARDGTSTADFDRTLAPFADVELLTQQDYVDNQNEWISDMLNLIYVLLGLSVLVSFFGMVNTLVLSTFERTRELGMLRAVGMTRRQVRRLVRHESVITALIGAVLGLIVGIALAALVSRRLSEFSTSEGGEGMTFSIPLASLLVFAVIAALAGMVAAILPARRASRLRILDALHYE
jgi:putative ABC transport system permease protein